MGDDEAMGSQRTPQRQLATAPTASTATTAKTVTTVPTSTTATTANKKNVPASTTATTAHCRLKKYEKAVHVVASGLT